MVLPSRLKRYVQALVSLETLVGIDLRQRRVARAGQVAIEHRPVRAVVFGLTRLREKRRQRQRPLLE